MSRPWKMRSDCAPHSPSQGEGGNRRKTAYAGGEHVKDSSERLKWPKRGRYAAAGADKGIGTDTRRCLKWPKRGRYSAADADKGIGTDVRRCLKWQKREWYAVADAGKGIEPDAKGCECPHS